MSTTLPDLESLACVDALARTLRFHAAARSRFLSPAAFSKRVLQVEEQVGVKLFARTTRVVEITDAGRALLPKIRRILADVQTLTPSSAPAPVDVVIGTRHELGMSWLYPARRPLRRSLPHVTVHMRFGGTADLERAVLALRVDAIVTSHPPSTTRLEALPIARETYVFVGAPALVRRTPLRRAEDAAAHTLIDADDDLPLFSYLGGSGLPVRFKNIVTLGTIDAIRAAVRDGEGVAVLPRYFVAADLRARRLVPLLPRVVLGHDWFRLVFRSDDDKRPLFEEMARLLSAKPPT